MSTLTPTDPDQAAVPEARPMTLTQRPSRLEDALTRGRACFKTFRSITNRWRLVTGALALGLMLATAQPAWAINYKAVSIATRTFHKPGLDEKACLLRAEQGLAAGGFRVWDAAEDGDRTVQGESDVAQVLATCVKEGQGTWGLVNAYADNLSDAERLAEAVRGRILDHSGS